jgi:hypothetical protein
MLALAQNAPTLRGYMVLGALTPEAATEQVFPASRVTGAAGHNAAAGAQILASAAAGQMLNASGGPDYIPGTAQCAAAAGSSGPNNLQLVQTSSGLALTGVSIGLVAAGTVTAATLAPFTMGISAIIGLFPLIFGHHAQAVKKEQSVLCSAVPAANNYLQIIDQAVQSGNATPAQAIAALNSLYSDFGSQVSSIRQGTDPGSSGTCNAACVEQAKLHAIIVEKISAYQDLANTSVTSSGPTTAPAISSGSVMVLPTSSSAASPAAAASWLPIAALLIGGFLLMQAA